MSATIIGLIGIIPFLVLFLGLTLTKIKSFITSFITLLVSAGLAYLFWHADSLTLVKSIYEGFLLAIVPIVWVIFAAVFTYFLSVETGGIEKIKGFLVTITPDRNIQAVLIAFCLGGFLESVAGFGTAVAIPTAMLMALGFEPVKAAVISLVANSVPVAFGALGIPVIVLAQISSLDVHTLTKFVALQLLPFAVMIPGALAVIANGGFKKIGKSLPEAVLIGVIFTAVQTLVAFFVGPELVAVAGSLFSLILYIAFKKIFTKSSSPVSYGPLLTAVFNYILLLVLVLTTRLISIPALKAFPFTLNIPGGVHTVTYDWVTTPGTLMFLSAVLGGIFQKAEWNQYKKALFTTLNKIKFSALTIIGIVALAKVMGNTGMIGSVAVTLAAFSGKLYPLIAPALGAIGTFVTGSDTSSNILLGELQKQTALKIGLNPDWITAANTSGATAGKMISPQSISVAASTVGIESREKEIIVKTIGFCAVYAVLLGIYVFIVSRFLGV